MKELLARIFSRPFLATELIAASLFANLLALASPIFVIQVLNRYVAYGVDSTLVTLTVGVVLAVLFEFGFRQVRLRMARAVSAPYDTRFAHGAFDVLTGAKTAAAGQLPAGVRREVLAGSDVVQGAYGASNVAAVLDVPFALLFVGALFLLSPVLAVIVILFIATAFIVSLILLAALRGPTRDLALASSRRAGLLDTAINASDTLRAFNAVGFVRDLWGKEAGGIQWLRGRIMARQGTVQSLSQGIQGLMGVAIITAAAILVVRGELNVGAMIGANILAARALGPISRLAQMGETLAKARQSTEMYREFIKLPQERVDGAGLSDYRGGLEIKDLAFLFSGTKRPLFESLNLTLEPGTVMVGSGSNGAGKTTLARLLVGLLEPTRGQILADGLDVAQMAPEWWRRQVAYMPQEPKFLNASLRENLTAVNPDLDDGGITRLIEMAGLRSFIEQSPDGLDMVISGNGENLSLGIRRRLALARALAHDGHLVVFDEPTEGLDREGCQRVYAIMNELAKRRRTIIVFSHDPRIIKGARYVLDLNSKPIPKVLVVTAGSQESGEATP